MSDQGHELSVTRHIAAAPDAVWKVMTDRMAEWWCPRPWQTEVIALDRFAGGRSAMVMKGPDGEEMPQEGLVLAYDEGRRLAFTDALTADLMPQTPFMIGLFEIAPEQDGTRYTATARHWTAEARDQHSEMGFEPGWGAVADQLKKLCETGSLDG